MSDGPDPGPAAAAAASAPADQTFFDYLQSLTPAEWEIRSAFLYRTRPKINNTSGHAYIGIFNQPFNESDVSAAHGGGSYKIMLKNRETKGLEKTFYFDIEGQPKIPTNHIIVDQGTGAPVQPAAAAATPAAPPGDPATLQLVNLLQNALERLDRKPDQGEQIEVLKKASETAIEMVKKNAGEKGNMDPVVAKILEAAVANMTRAPKEQSPMAQLKDMVELMTLVQGLQPKQSGGSLKDILKEIPAIAADLKEGLGIDIVGLLRGRGGAEPAEDSWKTTALSMLGDLARQVPGAIQQYREMRKEDFDRWLTVRQMGGQPALPAGARAPGTPAGLPQQPVHNPQPIAHATSQPHGQPAASVVQQSSEEQMIDAFLQKIVDGFDEGLSGEAVAAAFKLMQPELVAQVAPMMSNKDVVLAFAKANPILAPIASHEDFPQFMEDFINEIHGRTAAGGDEDEEDPPKSKVATMPPKPEGGNDGAA